MIKTLPKVLRYPNYDYTIRFVDNLEDCDDGSSEGNPNIIEKVKEVLSGTECTDKGILYPATCTVEIKKSSEILNKHLYCTFIAATILNNCSIELSHPEVIILGHGIYTLLEHNNVRHILKQLASEEYAKKTISVKLFDFNVRVRQHEKEELGIGLFVVNQMYILMLKSVPARLKFVVLVHELVELTSTLFNLSLKHSEVQSFAEQLVYVITHNNFTT